MCNSYGGLKADSHSFRDNDFLTATAILSIRDDRKSIHIACDSDFHKRDDDIFIIL
jgi:hypothetical protein